MELLFSCDGFVMGVQTTDIQREREREREGGGTKTILAGALHR
jgi:hypothetical protein